MLLITLQSPNSQSLVLIKTNNEDNKNKNVYSVHYLHSTVGWNSHLQVHNSNRIMAWGGEHIIQSTEDVLETCVPESCTTELTSVTLINSRETFQT